MVPEMEEHGPTAGQVLKGSLLVMLWVDHTVLLGTEMRLDTCEVSTLTPIVSVVLLFYF